VNKKITCLLLVVFIFPVLTLNLGYCYASNASVPFSYDDLSSALTIYSPAKDFTYSESDIMINASLHIGYHESEPGTHYIPYQNISCVYSLDGSEWQNMSLISVNIPEPFCSHVNPYWYSTAELGYSATSYDLPEGRHHLQFSIKPDSLVKHFSVYHSQDYDYSTRYQDYVNFAVKATGEEVPVSSTPSPSPTPSPTPTNTAEPTSSPEPQPEPFPTTLIIASVSIVAVIAIGFFVYFKKHKQNAYENSMKGNML
jgi:hypothetical protein